MRRVPNPISIPRRARPRSKMLRWAAGLSNLQMIEESKRGIRGSQLKAIQSETEFTMDQWARFLHLNTRTIQRYRNSDNLMSFDSSERALLLAQISEQGSSLFGSNERFYLWLEHPSRAFSGQRPLDLLESSIGMRLVQAEIMRIRHGVY